MPNSLCASRPRVPGWRLETAAAKTPRPDLRSHELDQCAKSETGCSLGAIGMPLFVILQTRDVQMYPGSVLGKFLKKFSRRYRPAPAIPNVLDVGDFAANQSPILVVERKLPEFFAGDGNVLAQPVDCLLIGSHDTGVDHPERDHASAGQSCDVDEAGCSQGPGVRQRICHDKTPLGIRVDDFHSLSRESSYHIARFCCAPAGKVLNCRNQPDHAMPRSKLSENNHGSEYGRTPGHVSLHPLHFFGRLDRDSPAVERDPFANECMERSSIPGLSLQLGNSQDKQLRRLLAPAA